jgi:hypothetical protein
MPALFTRMSSAAMPRERGRDGRFIGNIKYEHGSARQFPRQGFGARLVDIGDGDLRARGV